jgi:hypothetical protein
VLAADAEQERYAALVVPDVQRAEVDLLRRDGDRCGDDVAFDRHPALDHDGEDARPGWVTATR